eukprot:Skav203710  [mRNA]  locus=scaffold259:513003:514610:- [translate_table: standard]
MTKPSIHSPVPKCTGGCLEGEGLRQGTDKVDVVIAPTALHLGHVKAPLEALGMQVRRMPGKALVLRMEKQVGYTLIGHSERRSKYGETDEE